MCFENCFMHKLNDISFSMSYNLLSMPAMANGGVKRNSFLIENFFSAVPQKRDRIENPFGVEMRFVFALSATVSIFLTDKALKIKWVSCHDTFS